ncbi:beta-glucan synthesis-associated protein, variant 5 [Coprinopsis cinerea AmutBmut pab1-1]|nr:beta-glucan synthesis-associated protein, variant 5 [Coprinopsis cinerea AmutBmut pab1-1]
MRCNSLPTTNVPIYLQFSLAPDPRLWGSDLSPDLVETDDALHNPDAETGSKNDPKELLMNKRGIINLGCLLSICIGILFLFIGYPIVMYSRHRKLAVPGYNLGGINSTGQIPSLGNWGLIDLDTPKDAYVIESYKDGQRLQLVFSDEFNTDGRSFYPGDDPYWEAGDLHYWGTNNLEWYDPEAVTTANGSLVITFSEKNTHNLNYQGGLVTTWNKFCFTGGYIEAAVQLPGANNVAGMWPAVWTMGNLGRAGYGASLEGMVHFIAPFEFHNLWWTYSTFYSGPTPMMPATSEPLQIKPTMAFPTPPQSMETGHMTMHFPIFPARNSLDAPATGKITQVLNTLMERTSDEQRLKSTSSKRKWEASH